MTSESLSPLEPRPPTRTAAETVADVVRLRTGREIRLPPEFARAAIEQWFRVFGVEGDVVDGPSEATLTGVPLREDEWGLRVARAKWDLRLIAKRMGRTDGYLIHVFPKFRVTVAATQVPWILRAIEDVKPEELLPDGRPAPWVPLRVETERLGADDVADDDATLLERRDALPALERASEPDTPAQVTNAEVVATFERLVGVAGFADVELSLTRGTIDKRGFTSGRVWFTRDFRPIRIHLTTCPNADAAEVAATIVHELAHPLGRSTGHGDAFKAAFVALAEKAWGATWFVEARRRLDAPHDVLDRWIATGIRAALRGSEPPQARSGDDGHLARIVTRIRKLRDLATDQVGQPEAINATATANTLVTTYELGAYSVRIDARIGEQMVDRWIPLEDGAVWRRSLAHGIAKASNVFALSIPAKGRMHVFGRYADVTQAEYLFEICAARIERECARHLESWKARHPNRAAGDLVRERTSFCDSAVIEFCRKLERIVAEEAPDASRSTTPLDTAEEFARGEYEKRGRGWQSGGTRATRDNAAGRRVGGELEFVRGLGADGGAPKQLGGKR